MIGNSMLLRSCLFAALAFATANQVNAQDPPQDSLWITAAINRGQRTGKCDMVMKAIRGGFAEAFLTSSTQVGFDVLLTGPANRIECAAADAARKYKQFDLASMDSVELQPLLIVNARPNKPDRTSSGWQITPPASHVVLIPGDGSARSLAVQPDSVVLTDISWSNALGGKFEGRGVVGLFRFNQLPPGDFTVVIVTEGKEFRTKVSAKDRGRIR